MMVPGKKPHHPCKSRTYVSCPEAQVEMGELYLSGEHALEQDTEIAKDWFGMAARRGDMVGQCRYGECFLVEGEGEEEENDPGKAVSWFRISADQGKRKLANSE